MALKNAKYMKGTEGNPDYLVVAEEGNLRLGIKGFSKPGPGGTIALILRVRTQTKDGKMVKDKTQFVNAWPIQFTKLSTNRASCELTQLVNQSQLQFIKIINGAAKARFGSKAFDFFENLGINMACPREDLVEHLEDQWFSGAKEIINEADPAFILSTFVDFSLLSQNVPKGLTIDLFGVKVDGKIIVYPEVTDVSALLTTGEVEGTEGDGSNVIPLKPKTKAKAKAKTTPKKKPPK